MLLLELLTLCRRRRRHCCLCRRHRGFELRRHCWRRRLQKCECPLLRRGLVMYLSWCRRGLLSRRLMVSPRSSRCCRLGARYSTWRRRGGQLGAGRVKGRCCRVQVSNERLRHPWDAGLDERHEGRPNGPRVAREDRVHVAAGQRNCRRPRRRRLGLQQLRPVVRQFRRRQVICSNNRSDLGFKASDFGLRLKHCLSGRRCGADCPLNRDLHREARGKLIAGGADVLVDAPSGIVTGSVATESSLCGTKLVQLGAQGLGKLLRGWSWR